MDLPRHDDWLATFGASPQEAEEGIPRESVVLSPTSDESLLLTWDPYDTSLRVVWQQGGSVRVDVHRDGVRALRIEDRAGVGSFALVDYVSAGMVGSAALRVWPSFSFADALRYSE